MPGGKWGTTQKREQELKAKNPFKGLSRKRGPRAVHLDESGRPRCSQGRDDDRRFDLTPDPEAVTCGNCRDLLAGHHAKRKLAINKELHADRAWAREMHIAYRRNQAI